MKKALAAAAFFLFLNWSPASVGGPIIGAQEWYDTTELAGYSHNDIATVCDVTSGQCNGNLSGGEDLTGWTWASVEDVNGLFNHFIGSDYFQSVSFGSYTDPDQSLAASALALFNTTSSALDRYQTVFGITRTRDPRCCAPSTYWAVINQDTDTTAGSSSFNFYPIDIGFSSFQSGAWLYRSTTQVPEPFPLLTLLVVAVLAIGRRSFLQDRSR